MTRRTPLADKIHRNILDHTIDLHRFEAGVRQKIQKMLDALASELAADIVDSGLDTPRSDWQRSRLQALMREVERKIAETYGQIDSFTAEDLAGMAEVTANGVVLAVNGAMGGDFLRTVHWTPEYLSKLVGDTMIEGAPSAEWWGRAAASFRDDFLDQMRQGLLRGESITELRDRIVPKQDLRLKVNAPNASIIRKARRNAEALVRTSAISVANQAHMDAYRANADILGGVTWAATLDARSCARCGAMDGQSWSLEDTSHPVPALHWSCRCVLLPDTKSWEQLARQAKGDTRLAKLMDEMPPSTRASMDGQVSADLTYEKWFADQSETRQKEILGEGKFQLWKSGNLTFSDMLDQRGNVLTLDELRKKVSG